MNLSGGMKRRVSVGISLIGNPYVCYLDEPSTGLDPNSRKSLWTAVKKAKRSKGMILTTHSMEEAEELCDRIGTKARQLVCVCARVFFLAPPPFSLSSYRHFKRLYRLTMYAGIVVNGKLKCIGTPQDLSSRFGSKLILSATLSEGDADAETLDRMVKDLSPAATLTFNKYRTYKVRIGVYPSSYPIQIQFVDSLFSLQLCSMISPRTLLLFCPFSL